MHFMSIAEVCREIASANPGRGGCQAEQVAFHSSFVQLPGSPASGLLQHLDRPQAGSYI